MGNGYYFHQGWKFLLADEFPLKKAINKWQDKNGRFFYEKGYNDGNWQNVTLPHTFNDVDLFRARIRDEGSGQKRTVGFYRNWLNIPNDKKGHKILLEFEGIRQTCYLYVNEQLVGYYEAGTAPFGFDITPWIDYENPNLIAIATDNTATRNIDILIAETPNKPDVEPGSYLTYQNGTVDDAVKGVGFFWNCNDFNPSVGGITRPLKVHFKKPVYLTLPLYSNLMTKGTYVYGIDYNTVEKTAKTVVEAEVRNESGNDVDVYINVSVKKLSGEIAANFSSEKQSIKPAPKTDIPLSITPEDAYAVEYLDDGRKHYIPIDDESAVAPTMTESLNTEVIKAVSDDISMRFWSIDDPYLYKVEVELFADGELADSVVIETGFRKVGYDKNKGVTINDVPVWLRGYAQRASNEWAAIGIAPEWLKDIDAQLIKESNANHIRWMHVAASPADVRSYDRHGVVCTQPAGDKEQENFGRQWDQRVELMRDIIIAFRNHPSILFWEAGNNSINAEHMKEMRKLKELLDPSGGRFMGCRTLNTEEVVNESEYVGTMLNRHAARFLSEHGPIMETEYLREEAPRRIWDDFSPPDFDYRCKWLGKGGRKQPGFDFYDLTSEELALAAASGYSEFFNDRMGGASQKNWYSGCAALCWTDSAQHGRQAFSENGRMSGRVDAVRNKKQNFDVFRVMQSPVSAIKIFGHWNYPVDDGKNYEYYEKQFNGTYWEDTGKVLRRDPKNKTVYVIGSYDIARVEMKVNGKFVGECDKSIKTFIFPIENVDITQSGAVEAVGYDYSGKQVAYDIIKTVGKPSKVDLKLQTSPVGLIADGCDVAYIDIKVTDENGDICPLCYNRIDFEVSGECKFLGGYNSGKFEWDGNDSVIHADYVYAECGTNRVFVRSTKNVGDIKIVAKMEGVPSAEICFESNAADLNTITCDALPVYYEKYSDTAVKSVEEFIAIPQADAVKYIPDKEPRCKILVNGQEPDTRGVPSLNKNGCIWGAVQCILDRIPGLNNGRFEYNYSPEDKTLVLKSGEYIVEAQAGRTHLLVNGVENLMDGEPYVNDTGMFVMEVSAIVSYIQGVHAWYDDKVGVFRVETK